MYDSNGYVDFTATRQTEVDDANQRISFVLILDQQKQFRVRNVEMLGLDANTESNLRSKLKPGDVFNRRLIDDFLKEKKSALPADASDGDITLARDPRAGTVDVLVDFRTCPQPQD